MDKQPAKKLNFDQLELPEGFSQAVFARINQAEAKISRRKILAYRLSLAFSVTVSAFCGAYFGKVLFLSEFSKLAMLGISDLQTVASLWKEYAFSLLETLPTFSLIGTSLPIFVSMWLFRQYANLAKCENPRLVIN